MNNRSEEDEVNLLDYWRVIRKQRRMLIRLFCSAILLAMVVSLLLPKVYESTASILPQIDSKEGMGVGSLLALSGSGGAGGAGALAQGLGITLPGMPATPTDILVAMLKSRIMADAVIKQFDLMKLYNDKTMQDARKDLESDTTIKVSKEKVIKVTVEAKSPQLASDIANFYVANLDRLNRTLNLTKSGQNRDLIERRLVDTKTNLVKAEEAMREFQKKRKVVHIEEQGKAAIEA